VVAVAVAVARAMRGRGRAHDDVASYNGSAGSRTHDAPFADVR
jgi:hypothetical protein